MVIRMADAPLIARAAFVALLLIALGGCSTIKVVYNQADHIFMWKADDYFDLTAEQKELWRRHVNRLHTWHRATQLADYANLLEAANARLSAGVQEQDVQWAIDALMSRYRTLIERTHDDLAQVLATLNDDQLAAARRQFEKDNRKFARDFGIGQPADEQRRLRAKRNVDRVEHWTGPLSAAQDARLREASRTLPLISELRLNDRMRRQREFLALLQDRKEGPRFAAKLREWLLDWDRTRTPEYASQFDGFVKASARVYVDMFAQLTPEQRRHVSDRLRRYILVFKELAKETHAAAGTQP